MNRARFGILFALCLMLLSFASASSHEERGSEFRGTVTVSEARSADFFDDVSVVLIGGRVLETATPSSNGRFRFDGLSSGNYWIQVRKPGYRPPTIRPFKVRDNGSLSQVNRIFRLEPLLQDRYIFHWEEDETESGYEYASQTYVNQPVEVVFLDHGEELADASAALRLQHDYNIVLVNDDTSQWSNEHASRLMRTMERIPQEKRDAYREQTLPRSRWYLESRHLDDDISIDKQQDGTRVVRISEDAFVNANPKLVRVDGKRGRFFSQKLHHALVRFVTDHGRDEQASERILQDRYGVTMQIQDYRMLTLGTTDEGASRFQDFHSEEVVQIINMFEEMPQGMHRIEGLKYLIRRLNGTPHPDYPEAAAVAWTDSGYIEFMDSAFVSQDSFNVHRLIIHEKVHFLWDTLPQQLREDWVSLGGWYQTEFEEWRTSRSTEFVTAYAHGVSPEEDLAESIPFFILNPERLRSRAPEKYEFIRDRIMYGNTYLPQIREDLTFEVLNLWPDYSPPGKIKRVDIEVVGLLGEDKRVRIEIELRAEDRVFEGATMAQTRVFSEAGRYFDLWLYPENGDSEDTVLTGNATISKHHSSGYWTPDQIIIIDAHGNERYQTPEDFGWSLFVNNDPSNVFPSTPGYAPGTINITKSQYNPEVQVIEVSWLVDADPRQIQRSSGCFATLNDEHPDTYSHSEYGVYDPSRRICRVQFNMPDYMPDGIYTVAYIEVLDVLNVWHGTYFGPPEDGFYEHNGISDEATPYVTLITSRPDTTPPEVDVNRIELVAEPSNPDQPNGETYVSITLFTRDNISGLRYVCPNLRDPRGNDRHFCLDVPDAWELYSRVAPGEWEERLHVEILPIGSAPGIWGLSGIGLSDKAGNLAQYDFVEIARFEVE